MFIGWLKYRDVPNVVEIANSVGWLSDGFHLNLMLKHSPHLCYGAYAGDELIGAVLALEFENSAMIKYLMVKPTYQKQGIGKRLFETLVHVLKPEYEHIYLHANPKLQNFFESYGFEKKIEVGRYLNVGKVPPFHFNNAHAKELEGTNFDAVIQKIDHETFGEYRLAFLEDEMERNSSLRFALSNGFQHSSVISARNIYLGPWQVENGHEEEAVKLMKGVLYFRGLRRIYADIPLNQPHVVSLYESFHFKKEETFYHMAIGKEHIKFENIYAFSL
ncbi:MAG: GNAT family N-acetyltransferase [Epsilonproteobacteria bacterium]|nr:GNAT family N-acetyltransferase [Campylobacterota bacterium]